MLFSFTNVVFFCVPLLVSEIGTSVFRNADTPKIGRSDYRSAEMPILAFRIPEMPIFGILGLRSRQQKECLCLVSI